jgi:drug/metabolite transporter (DMT)-like permease
MGLNGSARPRRRAWVAYAFLATVMLFWAGNSIIGRAIREAVPPFTLAFARWSGALLLMAPWAIPAVRRDQAILRKHWPMVLLLGLCGVASFNALLYLALHYTTASNAILVQAAIPPVILVLNFMLFRERAAPLQMLGVTLSTLGVVLVVSRADPAVLLHMAFNRGDLLVLCAVIGWALYTVCLRKKPPLAPLTFLCATFLVGALVMLPLAVIEAAGGAHVVWRGTTFGALAYVAVLPSLVGYLLYNAAVEMIGAGRAGQTVTLMPVFGAFLAAALLGEPLHGYHYAGIAIILVGVALAALPRMQAR